MIAIFNAVVFLAAVYDRKSYIGDVVSNTDSHGQVSFEDLVSSHGTGHGSQIAYLSYWRTTYPCQSSSTHIQFQQILCTQ